MPVIRWRIGANLRRPTDFMRDLSGRRRELTVAFGCIAKRQLGFRLYYIRDVATAIGLGEAEARELAERQPEMKRAIFQGKTPWLPSPDVVDRLIEHLTLTADRRGLDEAPLVLRVQRLQERLRQLVPPVIARIEQDRVLLDLRTVLPQQDSELCGLLRGL